MIVLQFVFNGCKTLTEGHISQLFKKDVVEKKENITEAY
jgi:hypothetical protein